ncbi:MAG: sigma 54-interacting transcriptional regulator [Polyangiaceae bacterium]
MMSLSASEELALVVAWSSAEPDRVGEVAFFREGDTQVLGRETTSRRRGSRRCTLYRQRPGSLEPTRELSGERISREQLEIRSDGRALQVTNTGRCPLLFRGEAVDSCTVREGDSVQLKGQLILLAVRRGRTLPPMRVFPASALGDFARPDSLGILGESPAAYLLREQLAWTAQAAQHALVLGPSGSGKELAARALHTLSSRAAKPFVARNAATLPHGLVDAELFGNLRNYPNPGMSERAGLVGEAHGGTLFLDEIGELPETAQSHLLRVIDSYGEYHRLGESVARHADLRLIAATNRSVESLKHDLAARLPLRVDLPGLDRRREDIPLLTAHLARRARERSPQLTSHFFDASGAPRFSAELVEQLLHHPFTMHIRELDAMLWRAMATSAGDTIVPPVDATPMPRGEPSPPLAARGPENSEREPSSDAVRAALAANDGNVTRAARALGLSSRFALYRRMRKLGMSIEEGGKEHE